MSTTETTTATWDDDTAISLQTDEVDIPRWIDQDIDSATVDAIVQGGCDSGAYMPAVTYHTALETMSEHGDDVLDYITDAIGELPDVSGESWAGMACKYLSCAVELWASAVQSQLEDIKEV
jgi:hypothetical protein